MSKLVRSATIVNGKKLLTIIAKFSILDVFVSPVYASEISDYIQWFQSVPLPN